MTTTSFTLDVDGCIEKAITLSGGNPSQFEELQNARVDLNLLLSEWTTQNVNLWKVSFENVTVASSVALVSLNPNIVRPIHIAVQYGTSSTTDLAMKPISITDFNALPKKDTYSRPTQYLVERLKDQTNLRLWPVPTQRCVLKMAVLKRFDDVSRPTDGVDVPFRFLPALTYGLAFRMALGRDDGSQGWGAKLDRLERQSERTWMLATNEDTDNVPLRIQPSLR